MPEVSVACVEGGRELGFGRRLEAGIWMRRVAAALKSNRARTRPNEQESITENGFGKLVALGCCAEGWGSAAQLCMIRL